MSKRTLEQVVCDGCGAEQIFDRADPQQWQTLRQPKRAYASYRIVHLCWDCLAKLAELRDLGAVITSAD